MIKKGCEAKQVTIRKKNRISFEFKYDENSTFSLPHANYDNQFESSDENKCPVVKYSLALRDGDVKLTNSLDFAYINEAGDISFNFKNALMLNT